MNENGDFGEKSSFCFQLCYSAQIEPSGMNEKIYEAMQSIAHPLILKKIFRISRILQKQNLL